MSKRRYWQTEKDQRNQRRRQKLQRIMLWGLGGFFSIGLIIMIGSWIMMEFSKTGGGPSTASHLRGIYQGFEGYYVEHQVFPEDLGVLILDDYLPPKIFENPTSGRITMEIRQELGNYPENATVQEELKHRANWVNEHHDFVFHWSQMEWVITQTEMDRDYKARLVVAHERLDLDEDTIVLLFGDGHTRRVSRTEYEQLMSESDAFWKRLKEKGGSDE